MRNLQTTIDQAEAARPTPEPNAEDERQSRVRGWQGVAGAGLFMLLGILFLVWLGTPREVPAEGQPVGRLELKPLLNCETTLDEASLRDKITVLHFWGTWCEPCRKEFPEFVSAARRLSDLPNVQVISVSCSPGAEFDLAALKQATESFLVTSAPDMAVYSDPAALTRTQIGMLLPNAAFTYPCTVMTDEKGIIVGVWQGYSDHGMQEVIARATELNSLSH